MQIITVVHVLMFAQVSGDLSHFSVELYVYVLLLAKQDGILQVLKTHFFLDSKSVSLFSSVQKCPPFSL